jgi:hypothetical protein
MVVLDAAKWLDSVPLGNADLGAKSSSFNSHLQLHRLAAEGAQMVARPT